MRRSLNLLIWPPDAGLISRARSEHPSPQQRFAGSPRPARSRPLTHRGGGAHTASRRISHPRRSVEHIAQSALNAICPYLGPFGSPEDRLPAACGTRGVCCRRFRHFQVCGGMILTYTTSRDRLRDNHRYLRALSTTATRRRARHRKSGYDWLLRRAPRRHREISAMRGSRSPRAKLESG
jgi:hypothetical protein